MTSFEVEQKFRVPDHEAIERQLTERGATFLDEIEQVDTYFRHPSRDFATTDEALRLRRVGEKNFITYKGPRAKAAVKTRKEVELPIGNGEVTVNQMQTVWLALGFSIVAEVRKRRRSYHFQWEGAAVECALDQVVSLGCFVELELVAEEGEVEAAQTRIQSLAADLQLTQVERSSYLAMLLQQLEGDGPA